MGRLFMLYQNCDGDMYTTTADEDTELERWTKYAQHAFDDFKKHEKPIYVAVVEERVRIK